MLRVTVFQGLRRVYAGPAERVVLPGEDGQVAVLDWHAPMLCALGQGDVEADDARFPVRRGIARVARNQVTVVTR
jgi:F0F1-type ATP synthase epsilon subunit